MKSATGQKHLKEIALIFLRIGFLGFGGPAVHIAMMEEEFVRRRKWISAEHFLDLVGATNLIPGPNSTEMTMHCGYERGGWKGLWVAGLCFIGPAVLITSIVAWAYQRYGQLPHVLPFIYGIKPAIIAVIAILMYRLALKAVKSIWLGILGLLAIMLAWLGIHEIALLFGMGVLGMLVKVFDQYRQNRLMGLAPVILLQAEAVIADDKLVKLFLDLPEDRSYSMRKRLRIVCLYGCGTGSAALDNHGTTYRRHSRRAVHAGAGIFLRHLCGMANSGLAGRIGCQHCHFSAFLSVCGTSAAADSDTSKVKMVIGFY